MSKFLTVTKLTDEECKQAKEGTTSQSEAIEKIVEASLAKLEKEKKDESNILW